MSNIKKLKDIHGNDIYPITTTDAVFTSGGQSVSEYLSTSLNLLIQQIQSYEAKNEEVRQKLMDMLNEAGLTYDPNSSITDLLNRFLPANSGDGDESLSYDVKRISCGENFTFILKNDNTAYYAGLNTSYQLGINNNTNVSSLTQLTSSGQVYFTIDNIKQISCGGKHTFALKNDGTLWAAGANGSGQLGLGDTSIKERFLQVTRNITNDVKQIAAGYNHSVLLKNDGTVWSCGRNDYGQLGMTGVNYTVFNKISTLSNIVDIFSTLSYCAFALQSDGTVWSWGQSKNGETGLGTGNVTEPRAISINLKN